MRRALLLLSLAACEEHHEVEDVPANLCVRGTNDTVEIELILSCLSSSQYDREFSCEVSAEGSDLYVDSLFLYTTKGPNTLSDCGTETTTCSMAVAGDGAYTVHYGDETLPVTVTDGAVVLAPGEDAVCSEESSSVL